MAPFLLQQHPLVGRCYFALRRLASRLQITVTVPG